MAVGTYENSYNRNRTRIDGRTGNWATQAGVRSQHKDMRGNVIGGIGADGTRFGTKAQGSPSPMPTTPVAAPATAAAPAQPAVPPKPASITPRLDALPQTNPNATAQSNRSGAFGRGAQNLQARRDLFARMGQAGANPESFKGEAMRLGVSQTGWAAGLQRLRGETPTAPASMAQKPAAPQGVGAMAPQPNAKPGAAVPRPAVQSPIAAAAAVKPRATWSGNPYNVSAPANQAGQRSWAETTGAKRVPQQAPTPPTAPPNAGQQFAALTQPTTPQFTQPATPPTVQAIAGNPPATTPPPATSAVLQSPAQAAPTELGTRPAGLIAAGGAYANAVRSVTKPAAVNFVQKSIAGVQRANDLSTAASKSIGLAATAGEAAKSTTGAASATYKAAQAAHIADSTKFATTAKSLQKIAPLYQRAGTAIGRAGQIASLGKLGAAAGKAAPWVTAAQGLYETGALIGSKDRRERRTNELEQAVSGSRTLSGRGAVEGVLNPVATIYGAASQAGKAWDSRGNAKASASALKEAEARSAARTRVREALGDKWKTMTPKERMAAYKKAQ